MDEEARPPRPSGGPNAQTAGGVILVAGLVLIVGSVLNFASFQGFGLSESVGGLELFEGKASLGVGVGLLVIGVVVWGVRSFVARQGLGLLGILGSAFIVWVAVTLISGLDEEIPEEFAGQISVSAGVGLFVMLVGGILGLVGAGLTLFVPSEGEAVPPPPGASSTQIGRAHV